MKSCLRTFWSFIEIVSYRRASTHLSKAQKTMKIVAGDMKYQNKQGSPVLTMKISGSILYLVFSQNAKYRAGRWCSWDCKKP